MKIRLSFWKSTGTFLSILATLLCTETRAASLTWDTVGGDAATVTAGSGNWNTTAGNTVWNNAGTNVIWSQTSTTDGSNTATFAGADGNLDQYVITLGAQMAAESISFNSSGYRITGSTLALMPTTTTSGGITVAAGKTATINSILRYAHNTAASVSVGSGGTLNLGGGTTPSNNPQLAFTGVGSVNLTAGTYASNIGSIGTSSFNQTGGIYNITPGNNAGFNINSASQNVAYNLSAGTLTVNGNATVANGVSNAHLGIGNGTNSFTSSLNVSGTGILNVGTTAGTYGEIRIGNTTASNGTFNVSGGTVTVGTGAIGNKIYFFKNGASAGFTASMTQSAGTVTANGIQFGSSTGTYDANSAASLTLSGGTLYIGDRGIVRGSGDPVLSLPVIIKLQGGIVGASDNWSSSLNMKLGVISGGPVFQAETSGAISKDIALSGVLSDDDSVSGALTKTGGGKLTLSGANTYTGATRINAGTLALGASNVLPDTTAVSIGAATLNAETFSDTAGALDVTGSATINLGLGAALAFADSSSVDWTGGSLNITGTFIPGVSLRFGNTSSGLTAGQLASISITGFSNLILNESGYLTVGDSTPPTLTSIVDNKSAGPIAAGTTVTYTVTFNEPMDISTVNAADFDNAGTAGYTIGAITSVSSTVFTVQVTNTTAGSLILRIPTTATITDAVGNAFAGGIAQIDDTTISVNNSSAPVLLASNIVDDKSGQPVAPDMVVTYTLTFSEDMDASTLSAGDLSNAGTAFVDIGAITEISPGVFTVEVTPIGIGTLRLMVNADAEIRAASSGNVLNTSSAILDADTLSVGSYLFWDTVEGDGNALTSGGGSWDLITGNNVWNNVTNNVTWSQTSISDASNAAVFGGADGTADQYVVTIGTTATMAADSIHFTSSGYLITGGNLALRPTSTTNGDIVVVANKTATINSAISYSSNAIANITANSGAILNLAGGASNSQYRFAGAGSVNMTGGSYIANVGRVNSASFNHSGGTFNMNLPDGTDGYYVGYTAGQSVNYILSGTGIINANSSGTTQTNSFLAIGRTSGVTANKNTLTVLAGGNLNVGNGVSKAGELRIGFDSASNGKLDVQGGAVVIGQLTGTVNAANRIYFFKSGSSSGYAAEMTQSGGSVTANGMQFGGSTGTYHPASAANLTLSGGDLYIGAAGFSRGSAAADLPISIKLQGGTLGAHQNWSSSLDMKLGAATVRAQDATTTSRNITLSGVLSDDVGAGSLTKTGSGTLTLSGTDDNTYTGATNVNAGTLVLGKLNAVRSSSSLAIANGAALSLGTGPSTVPNLTFAGTGTLNFNVEGGGHSLSVNDTNGVTNSGAAGSITINITGNAPAAGTYTLIDYNGSIQGRGFSAYILGNTPTGKSYSLVNDSENGAVKLVVSSVYVWTGATSSEWSTAAIGGAKNWMKDGGAIDYTNDLAVIFDNTASSSIVDISSMDVSPLSVAFNSGSFTLQGTHTIAGPGAVTVASGATLKLGASEKLPHGAGAGNVVVNGILDLNGNSDTINGLTGTGIVDNTATGTTSTLTLGANAGANFTGSLANTIGTLALTKTGASDITLSGSNTYSGTTTINQGRLFLNAASAFSPNTAVTVNNGASLVLNAGSAPTFAQSISLASGSNLSQRQSATMSSVTLPGSGSVKFNFDDVATQAFSITTPQTLSGSLDIQVGGNHATVGNVTLNAIISGSGGSLVKSGPGRLILRGANTFVGGVTIKSGTLESQATPTTLGSGTVTIGGAGSTGATFLTGQPNSNPFVINAPDSGNLVIGANGAGSGFTLSGGITLNGNLNLQTFDNTISGSIKATAILTGGVTGTGHLLLNNLGLAANTITISGSGVNHTGTITLQGTSTGNTTISASIGANVTAITQNSATSLLILSAANSYDCDLSVNAGTIRISNHTNTANDASTVTIAETGATLDLTYSGTDQVGKLVIGTTELPSGIYGKLGSALPVIAIPQITGDGTLTVGNTSVTFASWITGTFANGQVLAGQQGAQDDADGDGISNLLEFAIEGQDPTVANPTIGSNSGSTLSFNKRQTPAIAGVTYAIEESTDLGVADDWDEVTGPGYINTATTISYSYDTNANPRNFLRLKVSQ